jgi:acyl-CoA thioester hydrolase
MSDPAKARPPHHRAEIRVRYEETDQGGVVYHANHFRYFEVGRTELLRSLGATYRDLEAAGTRLVVIEATARYLGPARYDDVLAVETTLREARGATLVFDYAIRIAGGDGPAVVEGSTTLACLGAQGRPKRLPEPLRGIVDRLAPR